MLYYNHNYILDRYSFFIRNRNRKFVSSLVAFFLLFQRYKSLIYFDINVLVVIVNSMYLSENTEFINIDINRHILIDIGK